MNMKFMKQKNNFAERLKKESPKVFEDFRDTWLRREFPYWDVDKKPIIWFCDMPFDMQVGYYVRYLRDRHSIEAPAKEFNILYNFKKLNMSWD